MLSPRLAVAGLSLALAAMPALAQQAGWVEVGGLGAYTKFDKNYNFDNGGGVGGRFGVFLSPMFQLEAEGSYMDIDRGGAELRINDDQANYTPLYFRGTANFPITPNGFALTAGAGLTRTSYRYTYNWGPSAAVGVKIPVLPFAALRVDVVGDYLPTPKRTNMSLRAGLSVYRRTTSNTVVERVTVVDEEALTRLRSDRARLDSIANAFTRLRDSLAANPPKACICDAPPAPLPVTKDRTPPAAAPIKTEKERRP